MILAYSVVRLVRSIKAEDSRVSMLLLLKSAVFKAVLLTIACKCVIWFPDKYKDSNDTILPINDSGKVCNSLLVIDLKY